MFLARLELEQIKELSDQLAAIIDPDTDSVYVLRQCSGCWEGAMTIGQASTDEPAPYWCVL